MQAEGSAWHNGERNEKVRTGKKGTVIISLKSAALKLKSDPQITSSAVGTSTTIDVDKRLDFFKSRQTPARTNLSISRAQMMVAAVRGTEFYFADGKQKLQKADLWLA